MKQTSKDSSLRTYVPPPSVSARDSPENGACLWSSWLLTGNSISSQLWHDLWNTCRPASPVDGITRVGVFSVFLVQWHVIFNPILPSYQIIFRKTEPTIVVVMHCCISWTYITAERPHQYKDYESITEMYKHVVSLLYVLTPGNSLHFAHTELFITAFKLAHFPDTFGMQQVPVRKSRWLKLPRK